MSVLYTTYILLLIGFVTCIMILIDRANYIMYPAYGLLFVILGLLGIIGTPVIFLELDSPLYTVASGLLGLTSLSIGFTELQKNNLESLEEVSHIIVISIFTYFTIESIPPVRKFLIEIVASNTYYVLSKWYTVSLTDGPVYGYRSEIVFTAMDPQLFTYIDIACTGIGAIALVWGIITVFNTTLKRRVVYSIISFMFIYILNIARNVFISVAFAEGWFSNNIVQKILIPNIHNPNLASFVVAETYIGQMLSAVLLFISLYIVMSWTELFDDIFDRIERDIEITWKNIFGD